MKYRLRAALAALALGIIPATVSAGSASSWILATQYVTQSHILSGVDKGWSSTTLKHNAATQHRFVANPNAFPPDPCRAVAIVWNVAVFQNRSQPVFDALLKLSAQHHCPLDVVRSDVANADGTYDLMSIAPTP